MAAPRWSCRTTRCLKAVRAIRRELLRQADLHTLLRLPTSIFYAQGPLKRRDLDDFVGCYFGRLGGAVPVVDGSRHNRVETERFK